ncbi:MAG: SMP-30/gluconolactonase/LRE family protein [Actinomycetia bacterium]|nr:SMP-30/gluconolactonase/LRE family protein [Actinomycetes bacterium]
MDLLTSGYGLIEGPVWDPERGLLFSDVQGGGVFAVTDDGDVSTVFEHRRGIGGMAGHTSGTGMIVSGRNIAFKPFDGGPTVELLAQDAGGRTAGFNDITTDAAGRIYAGELGASPFAEDRGQIAGVLWLIDLDGSARVVAEDVLLTNGLGFSPDGRTLYHSDSIRQTVYRYEVHDDGSLGDKRPFVETERGVPDGLVVSEDGAVWVALASGGAGVGVYEPDGHTRTFIDTPLPMCTSVCFGGAGLDRLYIVSGSEGTGSDRAGAIWVIDTDVAGLPVPPCTIGVEQGPSR